MQQNNFSFLIFDIKFSPFVPLEIWYVNYVDFKERY